jgi:hypothetical protein
LAVFFVLLAIYFLLRFCSHQSSRSLFLAGLFAACAGFIHPFGFLVIIAAISGLFVWNRQTLSLKHSLFLLFPPIVSLAVWVIYGLADFESFKLQLLWQWERMAGKDVIVHIGKFFNAYRFSPVILVVEVVSAVAAISGKIRTRSLLSAKFCGLCALIFFLVALRTAEPQHTIYFLPFCAIVASIFLSSPNKKSITAIMDRRTLIIGLFILNGFLHAGYFGWKYGFQQRNQTSLPALAALTRVHLNDAQSILLDGHPELSWGIRSAAPEVHIIEPPFFTLQLLRKAMARIDYIVITRGFRVQEDEREVEEKIRQYQEALARVAKRASLIAEVGSKVDWAYSARVYKIINEVNSKHTPDQ